MTSKLAVFQTVCRLFRKGARSVQPDPRAMEENPNFALPSWSFRSAELNRREIVPRKPARQRRSDG